MPNGQNMNRLKQELPPSQAANQTGRSPTEQVFAIKTLAEKAIISSNYKIYLLMLDMSKAFDTVDRKLLLSKVNYILKPDELHLMYKMIKDVKIKVRVKKEESNFFTTNVGVCQGDCLSAIMFIYYLAKAMESLPTHTIKEDHSHQVFWSELDWLVPRDPLNIQIDPKYVDDIHFVRSEKSKINQIKRVLHHTSVNNILA